MNTKEVLYTPQVALHDNSTEPKTDWYALILGLLLPFGVGVFISNESKLTLFAGWACIGIGLTWTVYKGWKRFKSRVWIKSGLASILIVGFVLSAYYNIRERLRPSFTLITPGVFLNGDTWDFIVNHSGAKSSFAVQILFVDNDNLDLLRHAKKELTPEGIRSYQLLTANPGGKSRRTREHF